MTHQDLLGLLLGFGLGEDGLVGVLVVGAEVEDVLDVAVILRFGRLGRFGRDAVFGQIVHPVEAAGLDHVVAVDGAEIVAHGDHLEAGVGPLGFQTFILHGVSVITHIIVRHQHEGRAAVGVVADGVHVHAHVAAGVAEGEHGLAADLLDDLGDLVHLEILDEQLIGADHVVPSLEHIFQTVLAMLAGGLERHVHADDALVGDVKHAFNEGAADEAVAAGADIAHKAVILQILHDLDHRGVETGGVGHALEAVHIAHKASGHEVRKLLERQPRISLGRVSCMEHIHVIGERFVDRVVAQHAPKLQHLGVRRIAGVLQDAPGQQIVLQIGRAELSAERAVHIEDRDAVGGRDVVRRGLIGYGLHIVDQRAERGCAVVPVGEDLLGGAAIVREGRAKGAQAEDHGENQTECEQLFHGHSP